MMMTYYFINGQQVTAEEYAKIVSKCLPAMLQEARVKAIEALANEWQNGAWADCPWVPDVVEQRLRSSNYFLAWLRKKAVLIRGEEVN